VAFRNDGRILGMKVETLGNVGAYLSNMATGGPTMVGSYGTGTYKIENFEAVAKVVVTNTVPVDAYRGYGRPEAARSSGVERSTNRAISRSTSARSWLRSRSFRASFGLRPENGSPERWRAEASWIGNFIRSPARRCGRPGRAPLWPRQG
jgi:aerobic carbon-monoxide dehydrogenase large subunit